MGLISSSVGSQLMPTVDGGRCFLGKGLDLEGLAKIQKLTPISSVCQMPQEGAWRELQWEGKRPPSKFQSAGAGLISWAEDGGTVISWLHGLH